VTAGLPALESSDEGAHTFDGTPDWTEAWHFGFFDHDATLGGYARITLAPGQKRAWYWAALYRRGELLVSVVDNEVGLPRLPGSLETRGNGLWIDHNCETPFEHWSIGAEAFALGVGDPADLVGSMRGDMVPFGLDLEWETNGPVQRLGPIVGYTMSCRVHGEILVGDEVLDSDWLGFRRHTWGPRGPNQLRLDSALLDKEQVEFTEQPANSEVSNWAAALEKTEITIPDNSVTTTFDPVAWLPTTANWSTGEAIAYLALGQTTTGRPAWLETH